jgi:DNA-binding protein YbaB
MFPPGDMDFGRLLRQSQERMQKLAAVQEQTAGLTGRAETPDGRIKVASTAGDPLAELQIDPRAMRMPAEDLAAAIRDTVRLARRDLEERVERITSEQYGEEDNPLNALGNTEELQRNLNDMQSMFQRTGQDAQTMLEDLQRMLGLRSDRG